jgi:uncharacterized membrane protein YdbT with pleckstrin-like domain
MAFNRKLLNEGEDLVLDLRPHWVFFFEPGLSFVIELVLLIFFVAITSGGLRTFFIWIAVISFVITAVWTLWRAANWHNINFVVTTDRVIYRSGLIRKRGVQIPLERVTNVVFEQSLWERIVGAGDLVIESAGADGRQIFEDVRHPDHVQNVIHHEMNENENRKFDRVRSDAPVAASTAADQLEKLEGMLQRGTITRAEFDAQKRRLLGELPPPPPPA